MPASFRAPWFWFAALALSGLPACSSGENRRCLPHETREDGRCIAKCALGEQFDSGRCLPICDAKSELIADACVPRCKGDEARDLESLACLPRCELGFELFQSHCVAKCTALEHRVDGVCRSPSAVRVNSVGFLPEQHKLALVATLEAPAFRVVRQDGEVAFEGTATGPTPNADTDEELWSLDFSTLRDEGRYSVVAGSLAPSAEFSIGANVYHDALRASLLGYYGWRCGSAVDFEHAGARFTHTECHTDDAALGFVGEPASTHVDAAGGWHDAGDYGKYVANAAFSVGMLLLAWEHFPAALRALETPEIPEHGGAVPDYLDEVRYELDWLLAMQTSNGAVHDKLTEANFGGFILPERDSSARALAPVSSEATADFAAALAMAARAFGEYDADYSAVCLSAATRAYAFLIDTPEQLPFDAEAAGFHTGRYNSSDTDDRLWAALELWASTEESQYLDYFETHALTAELSLSDAWDWTRVQNFAYFGYVTRASSERDSNVVAAVEAAVLGSAESLVTTADAHGYGRAIGSRYIWGSNGILIRAVLNLGAADQLQPDVRYRQVALRQLDYLFGLNPYARSFVTGVGFLPPYFPHHRPSAADKLTLPWPGLLVGGPNPAPPDQAQLEVLPALSWQDQQASYWSNEVAINWNAPLVYALAWANTP